MKIVDYAGNEIETGSDCIGCDSAQHKFSMPCGIAYEDEIITVLQDFELPIEGFVVVAPKRHVEFLEELTEVERNHVFSFVDKCLHALRHEIGICDEFNVIFEEKRNRHFHVWIMPRLDWMKQFGTTKNIGAIQNYAKENLRNQEEFDKIEKNISKLREILNR